MFYLGETPWHGLGNRLEVSPTIEEGIRLAGLDWTVERKQLVIEGTEAKVPAFATVRNTDQHVLGVVGRTYKPLQNIEAFKWFQPYLDSGEVELHTAGSLAGGSRVWVLALIKNSSAEIVEGDEILQFILLSNSHDGSSAIRAGLTGVRCVCANTVAAALSSAKSKLVRVRHSSNAPAALDKVRESLNLARREFTATAEGMRQMAVAGCNTSDLKRYVREVFEPKDDESADRLCERVVPLFEDGRGAELKGVKGTMWGAYNAVTELLTWERGRSADTRLENLWFGAAGNLAQRAYNVGLKMAA